MPYHNDLNSRPIQVLAIDCPIVGDPDPRLAWLQAYVLVTIQPTDDDTPVTGTVVIGERYADEMRLITSLEAALDPGAVLAGCELTEMVGRLGRLPIEASNSKPALALLDKLEAMLARPPIDVSMNRWLEGAFDEAMKERRSFAFPNGARGKQGSGSSLNAGLLVAQLVSTASSAARAIIEANAARGQKSGAVAALSNWRDAVLAEWQLLPPTVPATPNA